MDFFDKLGKQASRTYKYTTEKTSKIAREAKLRMQMNEHKGQIEELYEKIGKRMYENHISTDEIDVDIEEERKEILTLKEKKQCPNCFCEIELDYNYCPNCGDEQKSNNYEEFYNIKEDTKKDEKTEQDNDKKIDLNN